MKTTKAERDRYRLGFGFPSDFASIEYRLLDDADAAERMEAALQLCVEYFDAQGEHDPEERDRCPRCRAHDAARAALAAKPGGAT